MKLDYLQALKRVDEARGAWVLHGQEPLLEQNLLDALEMVIDYHREQTNILYKGRKIIKRKLNLA